MIYVYSSFLPPLHISDMSLLRTKKRRKYALQPPSFQGGYIWPPFPLPKRPKLGPILFRCIFNAQKNPELGKIGFVKNGFSFLQLKQQQRRRWIVSSRPDISVSFSSQHTIFCTQTKKEEKACRYFAGKLARRKKIVPLDTPPLERGKQEVANFHFKGISCYRLFCSFLPVWI